MRISRAGRQATGRGWARESQLALNVPHSSRAIIRPRDKRSPIPATTRKTHNAKNTRYAIPRAGRHSKQVPHSSMDNLFRPIKREKRGAASRRNGEVEDRVCVPQIFSNFGSRARVPKSSHRIHSHQKILDAMRFAPLQAFLNKIFLNFFSGGLLGNSRASIRWPWFKTKIENGPRQTMR